MPSEALARVHAPIGVDLGGQTPGEIAVSILSEIIAGWHGRRVTVDIEAEPRGAAAEGRDAG